MIINSPNPFPIYVSQRSAKNMWQDYSVFPDRIELRCWMLFRTLVIPAEEILGVEVRKPGLFWAVRWVALKLDWADLFEHVEIHRKSGLFRYIKLTPDNPADFVAACRSIMKSS